MRMVCMMSRTLLRTTLYLRVHTSGLLIKRSLLLLPLVCPSPFRTSMRALCPFIQVGGYCRCPERSPEPATRSPGPGGLPDGLAGRVVAIRVDVIILTASAQGFPRFPFVFSPSTRLGIRGALSPSHLSFGPCSLSSAVPAAVPPLLGPR